MHGAANPVVPYGQRVGGLQFYRDARYPHLRLRSRDGNQSAAARKFDIPRGQR